MLENMCLAFFRVVAIITNLSTLQMQRYKLFLMWQNRFFSLSSQNCIYNKKAAHESGLYNIIYIII